MPASAALFGSLASGSDTTQITPADTAAPALSAAESNEGEDPCSAYQAREEGCEVIDFEPLHFRVEAAPETTMIFETPDVIEVSLTNLAAR